MSQVNNTKIDNTKKKDVGMPMWNLIEHTDMYSETSGMLW